MASISTKAHSSHAHSKRRGIGVVGWTLAFFSLCTVTFGLAFGSEGQLFGTGESFFHSREFAAILQMIAACSVGAIWFTFLVRWLAPVFGSSATKESGRKKTAENEDMLEPVELAYMNVLQDETPFPLLPTLVIFGAAAYAFFNLYSLLSQ